MQSLGKVQRGEWSFDTIPEALPACHPGRVRESPATRLAPVFLQRWGTSRAQCFMHEGAGTSLVFSGPLHLVQAKAVVILFSSTDCRVSFGPCP